MSEQDYVRFGELKIFMHQIYEFKKEFGIWCSVR